ncbi:type I pullulanase [Anaerosacchariphilus polymeriproducens]|nr:type I pullulanase [Anaerosacchariphilus polymeriproducens]
MMDLERVRKPLEWKEIFDSEEFEKNYHYAGNDLGFCYDKEATKFKVWAPTATSVQLNLFRTGSDDELKAACIGEIKMERGDYGVWSCIVKGDIEGIYYTYTITSNGCTLETADVYAKACGVNGKRSMVVDLSKTNPKNWEKDYYRYDSSLQPVLYEIHIKDFSSNIHSGIKEEWRGKYLAFTQKNSTLDGEGEKPTCLAYLKDLGITHVHLMPVFDFGSVDESSDSDQFNWGYDPLNYNVPEGSYATDAFDGRVRIHEFKEMVKSLHEAGIGVVMDVVYNHTHNTESGFQSTVPYYYYRLNEEGKFSSGSGCGNDTASERYMFRKYMVESVCYWAQEYHIDGFRFDLMGLHDIKTMNTIRTALNELPGGEQIIMYGEPWSAGDTPMGKRAVPALKKNVEYLYDNIAIFCDDTRDIIKGSVFDKLDPGFVNGKKDLEEKVESSVCAWCDDKADFHPRNPGQIISYVSSHDNFTLWDKLEYTLKPAPRFSDHDRKIVQVNKMVAGIYMTCLGATFFQAGEEFARTKMGNDNSFNSSTQLNQLDWKRAYEFEGLIKYYKGLISLRAEFHGFREKNREMVSNIKFIKTKKEGMIAFLMKGDSKKCDKWNRLLIIYNANEQKYHLKLPKGNWNILSDGRKIYKHYGLLERRNQITIYPKSVMILGEEQEE